MLKTNEDRVVEFFLQCQPGPPKTRPHWGVDRHGSPFILPQIGGITLNIAAGDPASGWAGDHVEPGVSCTADTKEPYKHPNVSLQMYACAGNEAKVISGDAKDSTGYVIGHHGGSEHVIVEFLRSVKEKLSYEDKIMIRARGQGLKLIDYPDIVLFNLDPRLLKKMKIKKAKDGTLRVPVTTKVQGQCRLPPDVHVSLYRIAQEALNNIMKHASASQVTVSLECGGSSAGHGGQGEQRVRLCVSDNGCGFDPSDVPTDRLGLGIIRERAQGIGAALDIQSKHGSGTRITIVWAETLESNPVEINHGAA